ncbi:MAG: hypothetical protein HQ500_03970 [Flavobacteriales bacterium]|nr:hypothetical protein [Flavobacteriales bacterium]
MAKRVHITLSGSNEAEMLLLAKYMGDNNAQAEFSVTTTTAETLRILKVQRSAILVIALDEMMEVDIVDVLKGLGALRPPLKIVALLQSTAVDQTVLLKDLGVDRVIDSNQPNHYEAVQSIVQEMDELLPQDERQEREALTFSAWVGLIALVLLVLLAVSFLLL